MRNWNFKPDTPLPLFLGTDIRFSTMDYYDDQVWELTPGSGEPPTLTLQTTFGLRAKNCRIFPRFIEDDKTILDPADFIHPIKVTYFSPNYTSVSFSPLHGINVAIEYWVPEPHCVTARVRTVNSSGKSRLISLEWVALLNPLSGGQRMRPASVEFTHVLSGSTEGLIPVFCLSGAPHPGQGTFTSLMLELDLAPKSQVFTCCAAAALDSFANSFDLAMKTLSRQWDTETAKIFRANDDLLEIHTGDPAWDLAFTLTQQRAVGLLFDGSDKLEHSSYVTTRLPDTGFSHRDYGSDFRQGWSGQSPLETYYLIQALLPAYPEFAKGLLLNFLNTQDPSGFIDLTPGLVGQRSQILATPLLSSIAWKIFELTEDSSFLNQIFPMLLKFIEHWLKPQYDRDVDGIPEWDHARQTGIEDHPVFSAWNPASIGINITTVESPDLSAMLYHECSLLYQIANIIGQVDKVSHLQSTAHHLKTALDLSWSADDISYHYRDRDSHHCGEEEVIVAHHGSGEIVINRSFEKPVRLLLDIHSLEEITKPVQLFIHGNTPSGSHRIEKIDREEIHWHMGRARVTSATIYSTIEHIVIRGLADNDEVGIRTAGLEKQDITCLLPIWAGIPDPQRASLLINETIMNPRKFWGQSGVRIHGEKYPKEIGVNVSSNIVYIPYNVLIGDGLLRYGKHNQASALVTRMMKAVTNNLQKEGSFRHSYHSETGDGIGERHTLASLAPLGLFLDVLGVRVINPHKVILTGTNPFPWPVTIKYRGLTVLRQKNKTMVIFPDGQNTTIKNGQTFIVGIE